MQFCPTLHGRGNWISCAQPLMFQTLHLSYLGFLPISAKESNLYHSMYHLFEKNDFWQAQKSGLLNLSKVETSLGVFYRCFTEGIFGDVFWKNAPLFLLSASKTASTNASQKNAPPQKKCPFLGIFMGFLKPTLKTLNWVLSLRVNLGSLRVGTGAFLGALFQRRPLIGVFRGFFRGGFKVHFGGHKPPPPPKNAHL